MFEKQKFDKQDFDRMLCLISKFRTAFEQIQHSYKSAYSIYFGIVASMEYIVDQYRGL